MEDRELIEKSREGSEEAFAALVKKYKSKVFNLAYSMTHNRETADDMAQEAFIKAYFALPKFRFKSEFGTWLYQITLNTVKDHLRKEKRVKKVSYVDQKANLSADEDAVMKKERERETEERKRQVRDVIRMLPQKYQAILTLRDIQGVSYEKIGVILNLSPGTVDSRLHRARRMLRKKMAPFLLRRGGQS